MKGSKTYKMARNTTTKAAMLRSLILAAAAKTAIKLAKMATTPYLYAGEKNSNNERMMMKVATVMILLSKVL